MLRRGPLTFADDGQSGAGNDEVQAGARAGAPKRAGEMLTASRERGVIGGREIDAQHPDDRGQEALGLTQRSVEDETERQGGFDGEIGILELPAPPADARRCPRGDRVGREPAGDVASPHEGSVVLGPVPDAIRCLVLRMHSRLHIEIMTRRRSRWSTCRPLLAHRAESAHQRPGATQRALADQDHALEAGFRDGAHEALRVGVQVRRAGGASDGSDIGREERVAHGRPEERVAVMDEDPDVSQESVLGIGGVPHELGDPRPVGLGADARDLNAAAGQVNQDQHGEAGQAAWRPDHDSAAVGGAEHVPVGRETSRQVGRFLRSGAGSRPRSLRTLAMGPRAT